MQGLDFQVNRSRGAFPPGGFLVFSLKFTGLGQEGGWHAIL
jgi:hypothetical protein